MIKIENVAFFKIRKSTLLAVFNSLFLPQSPENVDIIRKSIWLSCTSSGICLKGSKTNIPVTTAEAERRE